MKKYFILASFISCLIISPAWAGPDCIYVPIDIKIIKLQNTELHILEQECINYPEGFIPNHLEAYFVTQNSNDASSNSIVEIDDDGTRIQGDHIDVLETPIGFPFLVIQGLNAQSRRIAKWKFD